MYKPLCLITAPVATRSGYGAHSRDIVRSLIELDKFLNYEDEVILNFYQKDVVQKKIDKNKVSKIFKNYKL